MSLGARLKELRISNNQSLQGVADAVGVSKAHIWEIEKGTSANPSMELLTKLADHFGKTVAFLVGEQTDLADTEMVALFRDLKSLDQPDQEFIKSAMKHLREKKRSS